MAYGGDHLLIPLGSHRTVPSDKPGFAFQKPITTEEIEGRLKHTPVHAWAFQGPDVSSIAPITGDRRIYETTDQAHLYQQFAGSSYDSQFHCASAGTMAVTGDTTWMESAGSAPNTWFVMEGFFPQSPAGARYILSKWHGASQTGWYLYKHVTSGYVFFMKDGTLGSSRMIAQPEGHRAVIVFGYSQDENSQFFVLRVGNTYYQTSVGIGAISGDMSNSAPGLFSVGNPLKSQFSFLAGFTDAIDATEALAVAHRYY